MHRGTWFECEELRPTLIAWAKTKLKAYFDGSTNIHRYFNLFVCPGNDDSVSLNHSYLITIVW